MQRHLDEFGALAVDVVAISGGSVEEHAALAASIGAEYSILSDRDGAVMADYGVEHPDAVPLIEDPVARPAIFLVGSGSRVLASWLTDNWRVRAHAGDLLAEIRALRSTASR